MARKRDPKRDEAFQIFLAAKGGIKLKDIAEQLGVAEGTVRGWKNKDSWESKSNGTFQKENTERSKKIKNVNDTTTPKPKAKAKNASGNPNPKNQFTKRNQAAMKHGLFSKFLPEETLAIMEAMDSASGADLLWDQIQIQYAAIIRAQQIMFVESKEDLTRELKREKHQSGKNGSATEIEYELQFAWDKHATFLNAQSRAMAELRSLIKQFIDAATEDDIRLLTLEKLKLDVEKSKVELSAMTGEGEDDAHEKAQAYKDMLNAQVEDVFADEVEEDV